MSRQTQRWLRLEQLDQRVTKWTNVLRSAPPPPKGWIRALRTALGMTHAQLAERMNVSKSRIGQIEAAEVDGSLTLGTFRKALAAMGVRPAIGVAMERSLEATVYEQAGRIADEMLHRVDHSMSLEAQATSKSRLEREREQLKKEFLNGPWRKLWH